MSKGVASRFVDEVVRLMGYLSRRNPRNLQQLETIVFATQMRFILPAQMAAFRYHCVVSELPLSQHPHRQPNRRLSK